MSLIKYTAEIVKAYVNRNEIPSGELVGLMGSVHQSLLELSQSSVQEHSVETVLAAHLSSVGEVAVGKQEIQPFVPLDQAVSYDAIICLICGKTNKAIRGHLSRTHGMEVREYQKMFSLPADFPMVAPSYSKRRRQLAIDAGLGEKLREGRASKKLLK